MNESFFSIGSILAIEALACVDQWQNGHYAELLRIFYTLEDEENQ